MLVHQKNDHAHAFRAAMRRVATGVAIVTASHDGVDFGMTATSFASVSMDPPLLLIVINETTTVFEPLLQSRSFCINVLNSAQEAIARRFSAKPSDESRFESGQWIRDHRSSARLRGAQAWIDCAVEDVVAAGTHSIFIGRVTGAQSPNTGTPLAYLDGRYARIDG